MDYVPHPSNNHVFKAPEGWDQEAVPCGDLPVTVSQLEGQITITSFWKPDAVELEALAAGRPVILMIFGNQQPVVSVGVEAL